MDLMTRLLLDSIYQGDCLVWDGYRSKTGYGQVRWAANLWSVHRLAYTEFVGDIPDGYGLMHSCDNPPCWWLDHLTPGTQAQNVADCVAKGRTPRGDKSRPRGVRAKLNPTLVWYIQQSGASGAELGRELGVSREAIWAVRAGRIWSWV